MAATQFRWTGGQVSTPAGLDYGAVDILRKASNVEPGLRFWERINIMESEVLRISSVRAERAARSGG